jgi:hypothetical protein
MIDPTQAKELMQQAATSTGVTGKLYIDVDPAEGFLRLKLVNLTNLDPAQLTSMLSYALSEIGKSLNLEVKIHTRQGGKNG